MTYCGRFAPSPTGPLHFGSLVAAVGSWLCARHAGGAWLVRMEDIDPPREVPGAAAAILAALPAFGLAPDAPVLFQSTRGAAYDEAFAQLRAAGRVFPCTCSRSQLAAAGGIHRDGACVHDSPVDREPAWRLRVPDVEIAFDDALLGPQCERLRETVGDFVVRRADGFYSYQLACVVDDAFQRVTDVVRGQDLLDSTARQIWLQRCLGLARRPTGTCRWCATAAATSSPSPPMPGRSTRPTPPRHCGARWLSWAGRSRTGPWAWTNCSPMRWSISIPPDCRIAAVVPSTDGL